MNETEDPTPSTEQGDDKDQARREALRTLGKAALYATPAVIATLTSAKALPVSEFEHPS